MINALSEWNEWWNGKEVESELIGRRRTKIIKELIELMDIREIKLVTGIRRSGKSTLFYQLIDFLLKSGVDSKEILLINFEDDILAGKKLRELFDVYQSNINSDKKPYLFLDEIHRCQDWVLFLRKLYDLKKLKQIFITDSSSKFIKPEYSGVVTGRNVAFNVFPLSFKEYLEWKNIEFNLKIIGGEEINKIKKILLEYLRWGGFPEIFSKQGITKKRLLLEYFSDIIHKDIVERYNVSYSKIKMLANFLVSNCATVFSPRNYAKTYGLSLDSINSYNQYFGEVFLFFFLAKFSYSINEQQISQKKIYVCDNGFFNNAGFKFNQDIGRLYENEVFLELNRRNKEIYYWKDKYECDFLIKEGLKITEAIQVCYEINEKNKKREVEGLLGALEKFKLKKGVIITDNKEGSENIKGKKIIYKPLWKFLLEDEFKSIKR